MMDAESDEDAPSKAGGVQQRRRYRKQKEEAEESDSSSSSDSSTDNEPPPQQGQSSCAVQFWFYDHARIRSWNQPVLSNKGKGNNGGL